MHNSVKMMAKPKKHQAHIQHSLARAHLIPTDTMKQESHFRVQPSWLTEKRKESKKEKQPAQSTIVGKFFCSFD